MVKIIVAICLILIIVATVTYFSYQRTVRTWPNEQHRNPNTRPDLAEWDDEGLFVTWLGHSTMLIRFHGLHILTDPVFSERVGVRFGFFTIGPKRHVSPALEIADLPPIDVVLLSHAHMDHFDLPSLRKIVGPSTEVVTAENTGRLLRRFRPKRIVELKPGEEETLVCGLTVTGQSVRHWGRRFPWNHDQGYLGYILNYRDISLFFAGDTAYTEDLSEVSTHKPLVTFMPIGAYAPNFRAAHCTPEEAWEMFKRTGAQYLIPMHHDTFVLSAEPVQEPMERLMKEAGEEEGRIVIRKHGDTFVHELGQASGMSSTSL